METDALIDGDLPPVGRWRKSSRCMSGSCVELRRIEGRGFEMRDSKQTVAGESQPTIMLPSDSLRVLFDELSGRLPAGSNEHVAVLTHPNGDTTICSRTTGVALRFDAAEIAVFAVSEDDFLSRVAG